jgi:excisionase family DNA binding protein
MPELSVFMTPSQVPVKLLLTVEEAARALSVGRTVMWELVMRRQVKSVKVGRSRRVPVAALEEFVARELANQ